MKSKLAMVTVIVGTSLMLAVSPVQAYWHGHNGSAWGAGIAGFAAGAIHRLGREVENAGRAMGLQISRFLAVISSVGFITVCADLGFRHTQRSSARGSAPFRSTAMHPAGPCGVCRATQTLQRTTCARRACRATGRPAYG
jgi:hypothetical protein